MHLPEKTVKEFSSIFTEGLEDWINFHVERPSLIFTEIEKTAEKTRTPVISPSGGAALALLIRMIQPKRVLELGTGIGYSASWMFSSGVPFHLNSADRNAEALEIARNFLKKTAGKDQSFDLERIHILEKMKNIKTLTEYDLIFIDCDKICYPELLSICMEKCRPGASIVFDNALWHGRVFPEIHTKPSDRAVQEFWTKTSEIKAKKTLIPAGDGLLLLELP